MLYLSEAIREAWKSRISCTIGVGLVILELIFWPNYLMHFPDFTLWLSGCFTPARQPMLRQAHGVDSRWSGEERQQWGTHSWGWARWWPGWLHFLRWHPVLAESQWSQQLEVRLVASCPTWWLSLVCGRPCDIVYLLGHMIPYVIGPVCCQLNDTT